MSQLWDAIQAGFLRLIEPVAATLARRRVNPNLLTSVGTFCTVAGGIVYGTGHIRTAGWIIGLTAIFDVLDGAVARRSGRSTVFGAFYDSTLDRLADGVVLGGLAVFYATSKLHGSVTMLVIALVGLIASFMVSYSRARAESLGIDAKVGIMQRPERIILLSAPQALFGLALGGRVLAAIVTLLTITACITVIQRILFVYRATTPTDRAPAPARAPEPQAPAPAPLQASNVPAYAPHRAHPILKGE